jgi:type I restriction enzyme M protein
MNMILHGVHYRQFNIKQEDTLERPQHMDKKFEAIVANPPFSAHWSASSLHLSDDRFSQYGRLAPRTTADFAFIQHMVYHLAENGIMAGGAEAHIRQYLVKDKNYLDAVIGLPPNIFYGTGIPTSILVFKKCKEHPDTIVFIDASKGFEKVGNQNYLRKAHIDHIIANYRERKAEEKYSYIATLDEVAANEYNLNIPRYVDTFKKEEAIDIDKVSANLKRLGQEIKEIDKLIAGYCQQLGIATPF